jgi:uncharacterized membrane protein
MKPLLILLIAFVISTFVIKALKKYFLLSLSARIAMSAMLFFTAVGHFIYSDGMVMMLPDFIPLKKEIIWFTGFAEILFGIGLLIPGVSRYAGWALIVFLVLILPANVYAALQHIDYQKGTTEGPGPQYLWFRVPLQFFFIAWVYLSSIYLGAAKIRHKLYQVRQSIDSPPG